ncbi:MAG: MFS transporter, partial [bacterium]
MNETASAGDSRSIPHLVLDPKQRWQVIGGLMLGLSLSALEATAVYTAMPTAVASLGGLKIYAWATSAYVLMSTVSM